MFAYKPLLIINFLNLDRLVLLQSVITKTVRGKRGKASPMHEGIMYLALYYCDSNVVVTAPGKLGILPAT